MMNAFVRLDALCELQLASLGIVSHHRLPSLQQQSLVNMKQALVLLVIVSVVVQAATAYSDASADVAGQQSRRLLFWRKPISQANIVLSLDLINASSGRKVTTLSNGMEIESPTEPTFNIQAVLKSGTSSKSVRSVRFGYDGNEKFAVESGSPYELCGSSTSPRFAKCTKMAYGTHTITATPYSRLSGRGISGKAVQIKFTIAPPAAPQPPAKAPITSAIEAPAQSTPVAAESAPIAPQQAPANAAPAKVPAMAPVGVPMAPIKTPVAVPAAQNVQNPTGSAPQQAPANVAPAKAPVTAPIKAPVAAPAAAPKTPVKAPTAAPKASTAPAFNIQLSFSSNVPGTHQAVITQAKEKWESVITGDMPDDNLAGLPINGNCNHPTAVDDLYICAEYIKINVPGVVGYGSSQWLNPISGLPSNGYIQFDPDAATSMLANGRFLPVIMHEMGHVLGRFRAAPNGWSLVACRSRVT
jgi:hypothetical protein